MFAVTYPKSRRQTKQAIEPTAEFLCNAIYIKHSTQTTTSSHCKPISSNRQMKGASNIYDRKKIVNPGALSTCVLNQWWMMMGTTKQPAYSPTITNRSPLPVKAQGGLVRVVLHLFHQIGRLSVWRGGLPSRQRNEDSLLCCSSGCSGNNTSGLLSCINHIDLIFTTKVTTKIAQDHHHHCQLTLFQSLNLYQDLWREDGRCGPDYPLADGSPGEIKDIF